MLTKELILAEDGITPLFYIDLETKPCADGTIDVSYTGHTVVDHAWQAKMQAQGILDGIIAKHAAESMWGKFMDNQPSTLPPSLARAQLVDLYRRIGFDSVPEEWVDAAVRHYVRGRPLRR